MEMPVIPQPTFYVFKCEQSAPPGMPKPSCVTDESRDLFNHFAQKLMQNIESAISLVSSNKLDMSTDHVK